MRWGHDLTPALSVIIPAFNEEENIPAVAERTARLLDELGYRWELILVDDGSRDDTFARMRLASARDRRIRAIRFSRNFGSHVAITAGLEHARGQACLVITADLEEPPEMIPAFVEQWRQGDEIVWGLRSSRVEAADARGEEYDPPTARNGYAGLVISLARQEWPDMSAYDDPEIAWRLRKRHHAGLIVAAPERERVRELLESYMQRFREDFHASLPAATRAAD
jgi:glycosyltransferase involved in cell wall biosynthesis